jgi:hypothetical protein
VTDKAVAKSVRDFYLQSLDLVGAKLQNTSGCQIYQVVMVLIRVAHAPLQARRTAAKGVSLEHSELLEAFDGPINGREGDARVDTDGAAVHFVDVRMILGFIDHLGDDETLTGHSQAPLSA